MEQVKQKVERSEKLLSNLTSEKERWSQQMEEFKNNINNLLGDTFLSSSFLAYIGFYDAFYRLGFHYTRSPFLGVTSQRAISSQ